MNNLSQRITACSVPEGKAAVFWLGQAGYIFKTTDGTLIAVDPYFSDCCERYFGFKRLMPKLMEADDINFDVLIVSHAHYDHFDIDSVPAMLAKGYTRLYSASDCRMECERLHLNEKQITYMKRGDCICENNVRICAVPCDHGELAPDALGFLMDISGKRIYFTGDTAYRPDLFENFNLCGADLLIAPINGAFGNMDEKQAAQAASILSPGRIIPCHFWNFAEHGGDPGKFAEYMKQTAPRIPYTLMSIGEMLLI